MLPALKPNWHRVALRAWSMRLLYGLAALQAMDALMPYFVDYTSPLWLKGAAFVITAMAAYARLTPQRNLPEEAREGDRAEP